jgi:hypothetical protein
MSKIEARLGTFDEVFKKIGDLVSQKTNNFFNFNRIIQCNCQR